MISSLRTAARALGLGASLFALAAAGFAQAGTIDVSPVAPSNTASALPKDWNKTAAFMEIFVRSYKDSNGDGIGDFKGLTQQLDYLQGLGVTGIWLMPIGPSQDHDHGYAQNDYRAIDPDYGTMADFDQFLAEAHKRGIGVIMDYVINHAGSGNPIFREAAASKASPYRDWFVFADKNPGWYDKKMRGVSGAYWNDPWKPASKEVPGGQGLYYGVFSDTMPDWNLRNPKVVEYLSDTMRFWMNKGVDGFRFDAVTMLYEDGNKSYFNNPKNPELVGTFRAVLDAYDNRYLICEVSEGADLYVKACSAFAYGTQGFIIDSAKKGVVEAGLIKQLNNPNRDIMPLALQSHDAYVGDRLINQFGVNGTANYRVAAAVSILASSTPFAYYGEEIGMSNGGVFNDPGIRSPMSWTGEPRTAGFTTSKPYRDVAINVETMNVADQAGDPDSMLAWYTALYNVRKAHPVIATGAFKLLTKAGDPVLAFSRTGANDQAIVAFNVSDKPQDVTLDIGAPGKAFKDALPGGAAAKSDASGKLTVRLDGKATVVFVP